MERHNSKSKTTFQLTCLTFQFPHPALQFVNKFVNIDSFCKTHFCANWNKNAALITVQTNQSLTSVLHNATGFLMGYLRFTKIVSIFLFDYKTLFDHYHHRRRTQII